MHRARLLVLGLSAPTLTMILDNLESCGEFPDVHVVNNLARADLEPFDHPRFRVTVSAGVRAPRRAGRRVPRA